MLFLIISLLQQKDLGNHRGCGQQHFHQFSDLMYWVEWARSWLSLLTAIYKWWLENMLPFMEEASCSWAFNLWYYLIAENGILLKSKASKEPNWYKALLTEGVSTPSCENSGSSERGWSTSWLSLGIICSCKPSGCKTIDWVIFR